MQRTISQLKSPPIKVACEWTRGCTTGLGSLVSSLQVGAVILDKQPAAALLSYC